MVNVLFWSVISAAFIGPGTITAAAKAGANYGYSLIWCLLFSIVSTAILQETSSRIAILSNKTPGEMISIYLNGRYSTIVKIIIGFTIGFGCTAYQSGNIIGAVSGFELISGESSNFNLITFTSLIILLLLIGSQRKLTFFLGAVVAIMGFSFVWMVFQMDFNLKQIFLSGLIPTLPKDSELLASSLIGTTIVPYNIFLGYHLASGQKVKQMRLGLIPAILIGGFISLCILLLGTGLTEEFSFLNFANSLSQTLGNFSVIFLGSGLFLAGLSSALTSPLAAQMTLNGLFKDRKFNWILFVVVFLGGFFGFIGGSPVYVIIVAQAINGLILPVVVIFLYIMVNDKRIVGDGNTNGLLANFLLLSIVGLVSFIGLKNLERAMELDFAIALYWVFIAAIIVILFVKTQFKFN
jgi:Mn2+/Fe2+ NRAMP family transporter